MSGWRLEWKTGRGLPGSLDGSALRPDAFGTLDLAGVRSLELCLDGRRLPLGDVFEAAPIEAREGPPRLIVSGSPQFDGLGSGMAGGVLEVDGSAGESLGAGMAGGAIIVHGDAGRFAGTEMRGGEIVIEGSAGSEIGLGMRRGLVAVAGEAAELAGHHMHAGTILVASGDLSLAGLEMRRGTLIGLEAAPPRHPGFTQNGFVHHVWLRILRRRLESLGFPFKPGAAEHLSGTRPLESWSGDRLSLGRGELLVRAEP